MAECAPVVDRSFVLTIGWIIRRMMVAQVTQAAWEAGLDVRHERAGADVKFTVSGPASAADRFVTAVCTVIKAR